MVKQKLLLLLIGLLFTTIEANSEPAKRVRVIKWHHTHKSIIPMPLEATLNENAIEIYFLENIKKQVVFQIKDEQGTILLQDIVVPSAKAIHLIDLLGIQVGNYEIHYIEDELTFIGEFEITNE